MGYEKSFSPLWRLKHVPKIGKKVGIQASTWKRKDIPQMLRGDKKGKVEKKEEVENKLQWEPRAHQ